DSQGLEDIGIISFSVDPETDSPEVLSEYMSWYSPSENIEWQMMTGYDFEYIRDYALNNLKTVVKAPQDGSNQVIHGTGIYLIDENGQLNAGLSLRFDKNDQEELYMAFDLIIKNGLVILPGGEKNVDVGITDGKIAAIADTIDADAEREIGRASCRERV